MPVWKRVRRALLVGVCVSSFLWPYESEAARRKDKDRSVSRVTRRENKRTPPVSQERRPVERMPQETLSEMLSNVRSSNEINKTNKESLTEALNLLSQTERGKWILSRLPKGINFEINSSLSPASGMYFDGARKLWLNQNMFDYISNAKTPVERQRWLLNLVSTLSHELTHGCQHNLSMCQRDGLSASDYTIMNKLIEVHAILEARSVRNQVLDLPSFRKVKEGRPKDFLIRIAERKQKEGFSLKAAERFARTEFIKAFWRNKPTQPIKIGSDLFFLPGTEVWNNSYNNVSFVNILGDRPQYYKERGNSIENQLRRTAAIMEVDISSDFFKDEKAFRYDHGRLVGYLDGIRNQEIDYLTIGQIGKRYENNYLRRIDLTITHPQDGQITDYWYGTKRVRATYTVRNKQLEGVYKEYDYNGNQVAEIPFEKGKANGIGWVMQNGEKTAKRFCRDFCYDLNEPSSRTNYYRQRYLEKQSQQDR